jgi:hypothetical protein
LSKKLKEKERSEVEEAKERPLRLDTGFATINT